MLHEFLRTHRNELIKRCRGKVSERSAPPVTQSEIDHGVPLFLDQLVEALRCEEAKPASQHGGVLDSPGTTAASVENSRTAAVHGKELLDRGYTVGQVVRDYGDICQAVTQLAMETRAPVSVDEFQTFNRLLDNAISDAVSSFGHHRDASISARGVRDQREWRGSLGDEQRALIDIAVNAFDALKVGQVGLRGATGALLETSLQKLRALIDESLPTEMAAPPRP
jgi:hypothetical protein